MPAAVLIGADCMILLNSPSKTSQQSLIPPNKPLPDTSSSIPWPSCGDFLRKPEMIT